MKVNSNNFRNKCRDLAGVAASEGRAFIIGEVAQTHDGSLGCAHAFIDAIADAGADAVKFQTHIAAEESTPAEPWRVKFSRQDATRYDYWKRMEFSAEQWAGLKEHADDRGIVFMSSPFSLAAVDLLAALGMRIWKVASGEISNHQLLDAMVATGYPIILSSGMSDWPELDDAVSRVKESGNELAVLQCTTAYPCPPEKTGLNLLSEIRDRYDVSVGLSDHSGKVFAGLAAVTLGAEVLEVHVTLSREMFGPDVKASVTTSELKELVNGSREIERMLASPLEKNAAAEEMGELRRLFNKSVVAGLALEAGTVLQAEHLKLKKPGTGLPPTELANLIGMKLKRDLSVDDLVLTADVE